MRCPGALKVDPCEVPPAHFRLLPFARKANGIVAAYKLIRTPVESLRSRELLPSPEQRIERSNDRLVVGRWLIARYQRDGVGARRGSLKQPSLALAGNQGRVAAIALTIRECIEGRDQAGTALRRMQLQVKISGGFATGEARSSVGNLPFARPWREFLEKPPWMGSSSAAGGKQSGRVTARVASLRGLAFAGIGSS